MIGAIEVGRASRLGFPVDPLAPLAGRPLLARTVEAARRCPSLEALYVLVPPGDAPAIEAALARLPDVRPAGGGKGRRARGGAPAAGKPVVVLPGEGPDIPGRERIRKLRRLAPSSWRAGWAIPFAAAEAGNPAWLLAALARAKADRVILFPPAAPFLDPLAVEEVIAESARHASVLARLSTAPPGLAGDVFDRSLIEECGRRGLPVDVSLRFAPDRPDRSLENKEVFHWFAADVSGSTVRLTAESRRGLALLLGTDSIHESLSGDPAPPGGICRALAGRPDAAAGPFPAEVRVQVTSRGRGAPIFDPPAGGAAGAGGPAADMDPVLFGRIAREAGAWQEVRLVIHGGEPLLHPRLPAMLEAARGSGAGIIEVETDGLGLDRPAIDLLVRSADVVSVTVDAVRPETHRGLGKAGSLEEVEAGVLGLLEAAGGPAGWPVVAVHFRQAAENRDEAEPFFDRWFPRTPFVVVRAPSDRAGQLPARALHPARTPARIACLRLTESLQVLPGGLAAACDVDFRGTAPAGDLTRSSVAEVWTSGPLRDLRAAHARGEWDRPPLCARCSDWCRR